MPAVNPFIDPGANVEAIDGSPVNYTAGPYVLRQQAVTPGTLAGGLMNTGYTAHSSANAAGTSENVAVHVAVVVAFALLGVYVLRQSGFKFVVAGSLG